MELDFSKKIMVTSKMQNCSPIVQNEPGIQACHLKKQQFSSDFGGFFTASNGWLLYKQFSGMCKIYILK